MVKGGLGGEGGRTRNTGAWRASWTRGAERGGVRFRGRCCTRLVVRQHCARPRRHRAPGIATTPRPPPRSPPARYTYPVRPYTPP
eukprot:5553968-Prymnesium_polylepis.1